MTASLYPSRVSLPTNTVITLDSLGIYSAASPGGVPISSINTVGTPVYVRAVVSDPFGHADITSLDVVIKNSSGVTVFSTTLDNANAVVVDDDTKRYEVAWTPTAPGVYTIETTAHEGFEGTITASDETTFEVAAFPDVVIAKSDGGVSVNAGQTVVYTLTYQNIGNGAATNVTINDTVPTHGTFNAGASSPGWTGGTETYTYTISSLAPGASGTVQFAVTVNSPLPAGVNLILNNVAIAAANEPLANQGNNTGSDTTPVNAAPDLVISKTDGDASVPAGGSVTYTITYSNIGTQNGTGVVITETLPSGATIHPSSLVANGGIWTQVAASQYTTPIGNLAAGANGTVQVTLVAPNPVADGVEQWTNTVTITDDGANGPDPNPGNNTATDTTPVDAAPNLVITKTDGGAATTVGGTILYTITYTNTGTQAARQVLIEETLPAYTTFDEVNSSGDWDDTGSGVFFLLVGDLAVGQTGVATFAVIVDNPWPDGEPMQVVNNILIGDDGGNGEDLDPSDNTATETTPIFNPAPTDADLQITKTNGVSEVNPGMVVTYTIVVTNAGPDTLVEGVSVRDVFPAALTNVTYTSVAAGGATGNTNPVGYVTEINDTVNLPLDSTITYTVTGTVDADSGVGLLTNVATVTKDGLVDPDTTNNTAIDEDPLIPVSDLSISKAFLRTVDADNSGSTTPGDTVVFTVTVTNSGPNDATGVIVKDELPSGFQYLSDNAAASGGIYAPGTGEWFIGNLSATAPSNTVSLQITARVNATGNYTNVAQVEASDSSDPDSTPGNNVPTEDDYASVTVPVLPVSDLSLSKVFTSYIDNDSSGNLSGGDTMTFTLNLNNAGLNVATGVVVQDQLPAGYTYLSHSGPGTFNGATGLWNVGSINVLETKTLIVNATINTGFDPATGAYRNYAQVLSSNSFDPDSTPGNNSTTEDDDATATPPISNVRVVKTIALAPGGDLDGTGGPTHGDTIVFTLTVSNSGPDLATGVVVEDVMPAGYDYVSDNGGASTSYDGLTETLTWNVGTIGTLTPKVLQITATLIGGLDPTGGAYTNYIQVVESDHFDPNSTPGNDSTDEDDDTTATLATADLSVAKAVVLATNPSGDLDGSGTITVGDVVAFTVTVSNAGPDLATGVIVTDQLPDGFAYLSDSSGGNYDFNTGQWNAGAVAAGDSKSIVIRATVTNTGNYTNVAQVTASGTYDPDSVPGNNNPAEDDYFSVTPTLGSAADLELTKVITGFNDVDSSGGLSPGDEVIFLLTLTNNGGRIRRRT
jgi:large repetitive protein